MSRRNSAAGSPAPAWERAEEERLRAGARPGGEAPGRGALRPVRGAGGGEEEGPGFEEDPLGEDIVPRRAEPSRPTATDYGDLAYRLLREVSEESGIRVRDLLHLARVRDRSEEKRKAGRDRVREEDERIWIRS